MFVLVDRGTGDRYVLPAKSVEESTVRLLLADHTEESLTVHTDGFRAYDPLETTKSLTASTSSTGTVNTLMERFT